MKFILPLSLFIVGAFAEPILTCENQKECISIDVNKVTDDTCDDGGCVYKICVSDDRSAECVKGTSLSSTWSHICDGGDSTFNEFSGCPRDQSTNFWDTDASNGYVGDVGGWEMCQYVTGGETAYFLMKDGNGCSPDGVDPLTATMTTGGDSPVDASCAPSEDGSTRFDDGTCTGNPEGVECVWQVVAPLCDAATEATQVTTAPAGPVDTPAITDAPAGPVDTPAITEAPASAPVCDGPMGDTESTYCAGNGVNFLQAVGPDPQDGFDIIWDIREGDAGDTIKFRVQNPFGSDADIYIQYHEKEGEEGAADGQCVAQMDVPGSIPNCNPTATTEVEAACIQPTGTSLSFSIVSIYFVTNDDTAGAGGGAVDECCHEDDKTKLAATAVPVVEYTYEIYCACPMADTGRNLRGNSPPFYM